MFVRVKKEEFSMDSQQGGVGGGKKMFFWRGKGRELEF